ncbi:MAG: cupredoxin domain-containing protein [Proteobacteria bacterium]|nr:cupredoxin domain-containing protein [Pseudomonadota bacterium]
MRHIILASSALHVLLVVVTLVSIVALTGCAAQDRKTDGKVTLYTKIDDHHFQPARLNVPANEPFWLAIDGEDEVYRSLVISSIDLNIPPKKIRAHVHESRWAEADAPVRNRIPIDPLKPGQYEVTCECHGTPTTLLLNAVPIALNSGGGTRR